MGWPGDQGVIVKAWILAGVGYIQRFSVQDCVSAEGDIAGCLPGFQAKAGLEPLAVFVDQGDQGDGDLERPPGDAGDPVKAFLGLGIQQFERTQCLQAFALCVRFCGFAHGRGLRVGSSGLWVGMVPTITPVLRLP